MEKGSRQFSGLIRGRMCGRVVCYLAGVCPITLGVGMRFPTTLIIVSLALVYSGGCRRKPELPLDVLAAGEPAAVGELVFDSEQHHAAMLKLGPVHHESMRVAAEAHAVLAAYEESLEGMTPEEMAEDPRWRELKAAADAADAARLEVRAEITSRIRSRMIHDAALAREQRQTAEAAQAGEDITLSNAGEAMGAVTEPEEQKAPARLRIGRPLAAKQPSDPQADGGPADPSTLPEDSLVRDMLKRMEEAEAQQRER